MKKVLAFLLVCLLVVFAGACGGGSDAEKSAAPTEDTSASQAPSVAPTETPTQTPSNDDPAAAYADDLIISFEVDEFGVASNAADGPEITAFRQSMMTAVYDDTLGRNVAVMPGSSGFYMAPLADYYDAMTEAFTVETCFNLTETPTSGYWAIVDNQENGGIGLEIHPGSTAEKALLKWFTHLDGKYETIEFEVDLNTWCHVVVTWDSQYVTVYLNGEEVDQYDSMWAFLKFTDIETAQHLAIGACCSQNNSGGNGMKGQLATCNLYLATMEAEDVAAIYQSLFPAAE